MGHGRREPDYATSSIAMILISQLCGYFAATANFERSFFAAVLQSNEKLIFH